MTPRIDRNIEELALSLIDQFSTGPEEKPTKSSSPEDSLKDLMKKRYLNYAMSVITSRALPDVRDGLKPVQRRILYTMFQDLKLLPTNRHRKSATITGSAMGTYHPHGDQAIYAAMARMAQDWVLRVPLVDGYGNFGNIDGDVQASMRYTEARLREAGALMLKEIRQKTVSFEPNFDGTSEEPTVLPAPFPQLLTNGCEGIAVGMATKIPPHNPVELLNACIDIVKNPSRKIETLVKNHIKGPDFPTGGVIVEKPSELVKMYEEGKGSFSLRGRWEVEQKGRMKKLVITEIPYGVAKQTLVADIASHVVENNLPLVLDVRDESTSDIRIVLDLKRGADPESVLAYLFKNTSFETKIHVNMTCLVPKGEGTLHPSRISLREALDHFISFRKEVQRNRLTFDLKTLQDRIHLLEGFIVVLRDASKALEILGQVKSKKEAHEAIKVFYGLDEVQTDMVLNTKVYRFSGYEIASIEEELEEKKAKSEELQDLLTDPSSFEALLIQEFRDVRKQLNEARLTGVEEDVLEAEYDEADFIENVAACVILSKQGWVRRQRDYTDLSTLRVRKDDEILWACRTKTRECALFVTNMGKVYTLRVDDLQDTSGYGEHIQSYFSFQDGEEVVNLYVTSEDSIQESGAFSVFSDSGKCLRIPMGSYLEPSTSKGRKILRLSKEDRLVSAFPHQEEDHVVLITRMGHGLTFPCPEIPEVKSAGKGLKAMSLQGRDTILAVGTSQGSQGGGVEVETTQGAVRSYRHTTLKEGSRGGSGEVLLSRDGFQRWVKTPQERS